MQRGPDVLETGPAQNQQLQITAEAEEFRRKWQRMANILLFLVFLGVLASLVVAIWHLATIREQKYIIAWGVAAFFVAIAVPVSLHAIHLNIIYYRHPLQRHYIRILFIIPIYAFESWLALRFGPQRIYLEVMRECYEAYVVFSFFSLLRDFLGDKDEDRAKKLITLVNEHSDGKIHHLRAILCCFASVLPRWKLGTEYLRVASINVLQYVPVKVLFALLVLICANIRTSEPCYAAATRRALETDPAAAGPGAGPSLRASNSSAAGNSTVVKTPPLPPPLPPAPRPPAPPAPHMYNIHVR